VPCLPCRLPAQDRHNRLTFKTWPQSALHRIRAVSIGTTTGNAASINAALSRPNKATASLLARRSGRRSRNEAARTPTSSPVMTKAVCAAFPAPPPLADRLEPFGGGPQAPARPEAWRLSHRILSPDGWVSTVSIGQPSRGMLCLVLRPCEGLPNVGGRLSSLLCDVLLSVPRVTRVPTDSVVDDRLDRDPISPLLPFLYPPIEPAASGLGCGLHLYRGFTSRRPASA
jgi:hypothetical protein